ncbi:MAG: S8 family serine peptidase [Proteobacteria bacterium]|nr:S8 family serine peptidase [Pseudomonadota bacterium]
MTYRILAALLALVVAASAPAAEKKRIEKAADLPRFTYKVNGKLDEVVRDPKLFAPFAAERKRDIQSILADYEIADAATLRGLHGELAALDFLAGDYAGARRELDRVKTLAEKPADKLLSGIQMRAILDAKAADGNADTPAYRDAVARDIAKVLAPMPYDVVKNDVSEMKERAEIISEALVLGRIREVIQPTVDKAGSLSSDMAPALTNARYAIVAVLPLKDKLADTYGSYLAAHKVEKADIWAARDVALEPGKPYTPVTIAVWDSGVDTKLFPNQVVMDGGKPAVIAFDKYSRPATGELYPVPDAMRAKVPELKATIKGFSDLQSNIDSPEATAVKKMLSGLKPDEYKSTVEQISMMGNYLHGTHVAGIALKGDPYAKLVVARIEFGYTLLPDPCPSDELAARDAAASQAYVDFLKANKVRVVNMSWGGDVQGYEHDLEVCGIGKTPDERKALARKYYDMSKNALTKAFASAPEILFVAAGGNENSDATFTESIPASIALPNLITVGAVDQAGDEASFTSYGPTVVVHANGYQVESVIPGGEKLAESGTSMAAPQVTNLAAKILAVNPTLTPPQVIAIIVATADKTADGRRTLINPKKAVAAAALRKAA